MSRATTRENVGVGLGSAQSEATAGAHDDVRADLVPAQSGATTRVAPTDGFRQTPLGPLPVEWEVVSIGSLVEEKTL